MGEKADQPQLELGRRERQIMDAIYSLGKASVGEVRGNLPDPPTYSAVRGMLGLLEKKGYLRHERDGLRYVYLPTVDARRLRKSALRHVVRTFFGGSVEQAVAALLEISDAKLPARERERFLEMIRRAKQEGR